MTKNETYLVTPSLLNSWLYIYQTQEEYTDKAYQDFITTLKREPVEPNEFMLRGIEFEDECVAGNVEKVSPIIENGCFQVVGTKRITVNNVNFLMYGRLDVLKQGVIYDIKRVNRYERPKYSWSCQHQFYLELIPQAKYFEYLAYDNYDNLHTERYFYNEDKKIENIIREFMRFLQKNNLIKIYYENWRSK